jgi:hypothetical protein
MPTLMALEGPRLGALRAAPRSQLLGISDTLLAHPWMVVGGLFLGGYLFHKGLSPTKIFGKPGSAGSIWGGHRMAQSRTKNLTGPRGRRRRRRR